MPQPLLRSLVSTCVIAGTLVAYSAAASATPAALLRTPNYESPVRGDPGELLLLSGAGLAAGDRVVYQVGENGSRPSAIPVSSTATRGIATIVATNAYAVSVRLPDVMLRGAPYNLWVVSARGEWSSAVTINDPRPSWVTPSFAYATADVAGLNRTVRVVGRNLGPTGSARGAVIRLKGLHQYVFAAHTLSDVRLRDYIVEGQLPRELAPGSYTVAISGDGHNWVPIEEQQLQVRPDPGPLPQLSVADPRFGGCQPNDDQDDATCFAAALDAAGAAGGGIVFVPAGTWDLTTARLPVNQGNGLVMGANVHLVGAGAALSSIVRHHTKKLPLPGALLTLTSDNSVTDLAFRDDERFESLAEARAVIQLGVHQNAAARGSRSSDVTNIVINNDTFYRVGLAIVDSATPIRNLLVTHNGFGAYDNALRLTGGGADRSRPFRIDDALFRWNRFVPGSFMNIATHQGTIASQIGAGHRLDFSTNVADGTSGDGLQDPEDPPGWRAAFFWNLNNNAEQLLISENRVSCSGDKTGDGEAIALDGNGDTYPFDVAQKVVAAGPDWIRVHATPREQAQGAPVPDGYYTGHWVWVMSGAGLGQARKILRYEVDRASGTTTFHISPAWDVIPELAVGRVVVGQQYWHTYIVGNDVDDRNPPCRKSNFDGPHGGVIGFWTPAADSVMENNVQFDTDGILYLQGYGPPDPSCATCSGSAAFSTALEIRGNRIEGESDWSSDCSWSGIRGVFFAPPIPQAPPPIVGFGTIIAGNTVSHADGERGGAIEISHAGTSGPPPGDWPMVENALVFHNVISDISGEAPRPQCKRNQRARTGIRIEGPKNVRDAVLYGNQCTKVDELLDDDGDHTVRVCPSDGADSCECAPP